MILPHKISFHVRLGFAAFALSLRLDVAVFLLFLPLTAIFSPISKKTKTTLQKTPERRIIFQDIPYKSIYTVSVAFQLGFQFGNGNHLEVENGCRQQNFCACLRRFDEVFHFSGTAGGNDFG